MDGSMAMGTGWLPDWLEVCLIVLYAGVVLVHLEHAWLLAGPGRLWHLSHIAMALGMIDMYWPSSLPVGERAGEVVFAVAAVLGVLAGCYAAARRASWQVWVVSVVDLSGMVYMFTMISHRLQPLTLVLVVWSVLEAVLWASGLGFGLLRVHRNGAPRGPATVTEHGVDLRITLTVMTLGMAYMFLVMQYGMPATGQTPDQMPGMGTGMSGM